MIGLVKRQDLLTLVCILWRISLWIGLTWAEQNVTLLVSPTRVPEKSDKLASSEITESPTVLPVTTPSSTLSLPDATLVGSVPIRTQSNQYSIDNSKPIHQTVMEVTEFVCGNSYFCDSIDVEDDNDDCFACQFPCPCETQCEDFGECCVDRLLNSFNSSRASLIDCITVGEISSYMIAKCPPGYQNSSTTAQQCETPDVSQIGYTVPVSVTKTQVTYKNQYCAICNGLDETDFENWSYKIKCHGNAFNHLSNDELWALVNRSPDACSVEYLPPTGINVRHCPKGMVMTCTIENNNVNILSKYLCKQFTSPIIYRGITYRNIFCAMCNGVLLDKDEICGLSPDEDIDTPPVTSRPLSALINFDPMFEPDLPADETATSVDSMCKIGNIYDPFQGQCLMPQCSERRILIRGSCEPMFATVKGLGYSVFFTMIPERDITRWDTFTSEYMNLFRKILESVYPYYIQSVRFHIFVSLGDTTGSEVFKGTTVEADILILADVPLKVVEEILQNMFVMSWAFKSADETIVINSAPFACSSSSGEIDFGRIREEIIKGSPELIVNECDDNCLGQIEFLEFKTALNCPFVELSLAKSNLQYTQETGALVALDGILSINASSYLKCGETIWVCISALEGIGVTTTTTTTTRMMTSIENHTTYVQYKPKEGKSLTIVSAVFITFSMAFLILVFLMHCLLPKLRTTAGKNNMFTILNLFAAQLFFLSGHGATENDALCRTLGIFIHYFWVSSFIWLAVDAHYIYNQCSKVIGESHNHVDTKSTLIRNILISNGLSVILILVCISYHLANSSGMEVGYGGKACFLSKPGDIGMYFAAPFGIALGCNIYFFIVTVGALRRMPDALEVTNRPQKTIALLYFKWSIFIGVSWLFGCFAAALNSGVLWYIFIILCGFQGVFIFVTFCSDELTWKMLKEKFEKFVPKKLPAAEDNLDTNQTTSSRV